jgi:hypothetical protein
MFVAPVFFVQPGVVLQCEPFGLTTDPARRQSEHRENTQLSIQMKNNSVPFFGFY